MKQDLVLILHLQEPDSLFFTFKTLGLADAATFNGQNLTGQYIF